MAAVVWSRGGLFRVSLLILMLTSLWLLAVATHNSELFGRLHPWLLLLTSVCLIGLLGLIVWNLARLLDQRRRDVPGSRLTLRLVAMFVVLAVVPVSVVYVFSMQFLNRGIESWFDSRTEQQAMEDALNLSQAALDVRTRELLGRMERAAQGLGFVPESAAAISLDEERARMGARELTLMTSNGRIIATSASEPVARLPIRPEEDILLQLRQGRPYAGLDPGDDVGLQVRILVLAGAIDGMVDLRILQGVFPVSARVDALAESVQTHYARYQELGYLRRPLQDSFVLTLSLVLLTSLLFAVWSAFFAARRMVAPIRDLADGTRAVAAGDYGRQLPVAGSDELGFLVRSFNDMSRSVALARDEASHSRIQIEGQRAYLEALLGRLSSGVMAIGGDGCLRTHNQAADQILGVDLGHWHGRHLADMTASSPELCPLSEAIGRFVDGGRREWREQLSLARSSGRQVLMCNGTALPGSAGGHVIVLDDITALIQAQREAAWSEVARRLAHEIKNPLTPIQLAAERMRQRCLPALQGREAEVLDRATVTIVNQVAAMKTMVDAFSDYARAPAFQVRALQLNDLVVDVLELYQTGAGAAPVVELALAPDLPIFSADPGRLRQLLHNLVKNALEATPGGEPCRLKVATRLLRAPDAADAVIELTIRDHGPGFEERMLGQVFEPYTTSKPRGTGLGLPIVKKIVEEHHGSIHAENCSPGALITVCFPVAAHSDQAAVA